MSSGFQSSLSGRPPHSPKPPPSEIEANLVDLGLLGFKSKRKKQTKPKVVEFGPPEVQHSTYTTTRQCLRAQARSCLF